MTKKVTKNVKAIDLIERVGELHFCKKPTNEDLVKITSALGGCDYQTELTKIERRDCYCHEEIKTTIYILNIYKKITEEVEE